MTRKEILRREFKGVCKRATEMIPEMAYHEYQRDHLFSLGFDVYGLCRDDIYEIFREVFKTCFIDR